MYFLLIKFQNLTATISDHLPQFMIVPNEFSNPPSNSSNFIEEIGQILIKSILYLNTILYFSIDIDDALKINEENIDYSTQTFLKVACMVNSKLVFTD